jgi:hypothetical protein
MVLRFMTSYILHAENTVGLSELYKMQLGGYSRCRPLKQFSNTVAYSTIFSLLFLASLPSLDLLKFGGCTVSRREFRYE